VAALYRLDKRQLLSHAGRVPGWARSILISFMEEPLPVQESPPDVPQPPAMTLAARLLNVFAVPGEVFVGVKAGRFCVGNWLLPALLSAAVGVLTIIVLLSQPSIQRQVREAGEQKAKQVNQQVTAGKMTRADANQVQAATRIITDPAILKVAGSMAAALICFARVFWWAFLLWLLGRRFLKAPFGYLKALEVAGLALMISVLGGIVMLLLTVNLAKMFATPSLALVVADFDATRKSHLLIGAANLFSFWLVGVLSVGLAKLAGVPFLRAAWFVFAVWVIQESFFVLLGGMLGQFAL
jgi:hypothetical protein